MAFHALEVSDSEFMSHDHTQFVAFSRNKTELIKLGHMLEAISCSISTNIESRNEPESELCVFTRNLSDFNYSSTSEDIVTLTQGETMIQESLAENSEINAYSRNIVVLDGLGGAGVAKVLACHLPVPSKFIQGYNQKKRAIKSGKYYSNPDKFDYFQGIHIGILPHQI